MLLRLLWWSMIIYILFIYNYCWLLLSQDLHYHTRFLLVNWSVRHFSFFVLILRYWIFFDHLFECHFLCLCINVDFVGQLWIQFFLFYTQIISFTSVENVILKYYDGNGFLEIVTICLCQMFVFILFIFWTKFTSSMLIRNRTENIHM